MDIPSFETNEVSRVRGISNRQRKKDGISTGMMYTTRYDRTAGTNDCTR